MDVILTKGDFYRLLFISPAIVVNFSLQELQSANLDEMFNILQATFSNACFRYSFEFYYHFQSRVVSWQKPSIGQNSKRWQAITWPLKSTWYNSLWISGTSIGPCSGLLSDDTKPKPKPKLTYTVSSMSPTGLSYMDTCSRAKSIKPKSSLCWITQHNPSLSEASYLRCLIAESTTFYENHFQSRRSNFKDRWVCALVIEEQSI